jgi:hypothetical protein
MFCHLFFFLFNVLHQNSNCKVHSFKYQELLLLEDDVKALEEMYPQGEQVA